MQAHDDTAVAGTNAQGHQTLLPLPSPYDAQHGTGSTAAHLLLTLGGEVDALMGESIRING